MGYEPRCERKHIAELEWQQLIFLTGRLVDLSRCPCIVTSFGQINIVRAFELSCAHTSAY